MTKRTPCRLAEWDTAFFGRRIARLEAARLTPAALRAARQWCRRQKVECLYFLAAADDPAVVALVEAAGFHLVDVRVTLGRDVAQPVARAADAGGWTIRAWREGDVQAMKAIARTAYGDTRFYTDGHFPREDCNRLYETWIERSCRGYADAVFVAESGGRLDGFISCHAGDGTTAQLGLVGIRPERAGAGLGRRLVVRAIEWCRQRGIASLQVVTQGRNIRAQRLYQRCGFITESVGLWYHWWPADTSRSES